VACWFSLQSCCHSIDLGINFDLHREHELILLILVWHRDKPLRIDCFHAYIDFREVRRTKFIFFIEYAHNRAILDAFTGYVSRVGFRFGLCGNVILQMHINNENCHSVSIANHFFGLLNQGETTFKRCLGTHHLENLVGNLLNFCQQGFLFGRWGSIDMT
jgi:hypothetical protein